MPYSRNAKYTHNRQQQPDLFQKGTFKTVPLSHTDYAGTKFSKKTSLAVVAKKKKTGKWSIQSILNPKNK